MPVYKEKYSLVWVSHSSMGDFIKCPRAYFLKNVYRNPKTRRKMTVVSPPLALGQAVHEVLESLSILPSEERFARSLDEKFEAAWKKVSGKLGGFLMEQQEVDYKHRARLMIERVVKYPGPLLNKAIKIKKDLPNYILSEEDGIILCGKIDWMEYMPDTDSVHILDFKTGKNDEEAGSLQLPIYYLLVTNTQKRHVTKASYWYIDREDTPREVTLPDLQESYEKVLAIAREVKKARVSETYICRKLGCFACKPFEQVLAGTAEFVGVGGYDQELYMLPPESSSIRPILATTPEIDESVIL
jgi:ATP-dependent helicase/DNAse subunit B